MNSEVSGAASNETEQVPYAPPVAANPAYAPPVGYAQVGEQGDATGGLIPYKNPCALIAYYLGILGMFPLLGLFFAIPAFVLGIIGLRNRARNPVIKGTVHAWIGIVLGGIFTLLYSLVLIVLVVALVAG